MADPLPLTGERTLPGIPEENYWFQRHVAAYRFAATALPRGGRVLDVGCGEGYGAAALARSRVAAGRVIAFEYERAAATHAARTYPRLSVSVADACHLPLAEGCVDGIVAMQVLEHLYCADRFVAACRRGLRPGGVLVLTTPNRPTFSPEGVTNPFHVYEYDAEELAALLGVHFARVRMLGLRNGARLMLRERRAGPLQEALMTSAFHELSPAHRRMVAAMRPGHFRIGPRRVERSLDLVAVCRA